MGRTDGWDDTAIIRKVGGGMISAKQQKLADRLKEWRARNDLTQEQAAKKLGLSLRTYHGIEAGRGFRFEHLLELALQSMERQS